MKKYYFLTILIFLNISCDTTPTSIQKDESEIPVVIDNLTGTWNWIQSVDSTDQVVDAQTSNKTRSIIIAQDYTFEEYLNDTLNFKDKFNLLKTVLSNSIETLSFMDWRTSKRFNYAIYSLKPKILIIGYSWGYKQKYSRVN
jgi:hypothetical protein